MTPAASTHEIPRASRSRLGVALVIWHGKDELLLVTMYCVR